MADLLNIPLSVRKDGRSFLPSLLHGKSATGERYLIFGSNEGPAIIMNNGWKLRCYLKENVWELFYLPDDPQERHDLSKEQPKRVKEMKELLMKECGGDVQNGINRYG
jgi:arylsulfatase A-like enzyme